MYSERVTTQAIEAANIQQGWELQPHSQAQIDAAIAHFDGLFDLESGRLARKLTDEESRFISNERKLCALDYRYWCNPPEAPIWMADLTFKPLGSIRVGDKVMGWEKADRPKLAKRFIWDHYTESTVLSIMRRIAPIIEVTLESGRQIRCTPDHQWSNGSTGCSVSYKDVNDRRREYSYPWTVAKIGARLRFAVAPCSLNDLSTPQQKTAAWLGGIFDGEGSASASSVSIAQSESHNPDVYEAIRSVLDSLGFEFSHNPKAFQLRGGMPESVRFLNLCQPVRSRQIVKHLSRQVLCSSDRVVNVRYVGEGEVVSMKTTTGNYVAWGYLSKNCSGYHWIVDKEQKPVRFQRNIAQGILLQIWSEFEEQARAIHVQNLKARRLGVSTETEAATQHRFQFHPYSNCVVASSDPDKSVSMAKMIDFSLQKQPWWLVGQEGRQAKNMLAEFKDINTSLTIQAGNQFTGVARGATPSVVHLSELASWIDPESLVDAALYRAIIDHPDVFCILESTAEGRGNWWHRTWEQNKKDWDRGRGRVRPVFLPWYIGTDLYPSATDLRARPIPSDWTPSDRTIRHAERARSYVLANPLLFKYLAKGDREWRMPKAQMWFHEIEYETALAKKELNLFLSELPADDIEAFQSEAISVVGQEVILNYRERVREPWGVFTILGRDIPQSLTVSRRQWDPSKPPIQIKTTGILRINDTYTLQPLLWDGFAAASDPDFKLFVWEPPHDDVIYGQGVDTGDGLGQDGSAIEMLRKGTALSYPAQVAEFQSPYIKAFQFWPMTLALACWYSTFNSKVGKRVQIRSAIECRTNGEAVQHEMQKRGWWNFHPWKRYDNRKQTPDGKVTKLGVFTNEWFRSQMMDYILTLLDEESFDVYSPWFIDEMASIERDPDEQKAQACFAADTPVTMWDGRQKAISDVRVGDFVLSHLGTREMVTLTHSFNNDKHLRLVKVAGLPDPIACTPSHQWWSKRRVKKQMGVLAGRKIPQSEWVSALDLKSGDWIGIPKRKGLSSCQLTDEMLYSIGFWLAEGHYLYDKDGLPVGLAFTNCETAYLDRAESGMKAMFPTNTIRNNQFGGTREIATRTYKSSRKRGAWREVHEFLFYHREAAQWFMQTFGAGSSKKALSVAFYTQTGLLPLVAGFVDGDGSHRQGQSEDVTIYTTSEVLVWQLRQVLIDYGIWATLGRCTRPSERHRPQWYLNIKASFLSKLSGSIKIRPVNVKHTRHVIEDDDFFYAPIRKIDFTKPEREVFDLTVTGPHTYVAGGAAVHNSYGEHDDRFMAMGFILFSLYVDDISKRGGIQRPPPPVIHSPYEDPSVDRTVPYATYTPGLQSMDIANRLALPVQRPRRGPSSLGALRRPTSGRGW